jgi:hypothetical protein
LEDHTTTLSRMAGQSAEELGQSQSLRPAMALVSAEVRILNHGGREAVLGWAAAIIRRQLRPEEAESDDERG